MKNKKIFTVKRVLFLLFVSLLMLNGGLAYAISHGYMKNIKWNTKGDSVPMSEQSLDVLYDNDEDSKKIKEDFNNLSSKMLLDNGSLTKETSDSNIKKLKSYIKKMNPESNLEKYNLILTTIEEKFSVRKSYNTLFEDSTTLNKDITPKNVLDVYNKNSALIEKYFDKNSNDVFVTEMLDIQYKLSSDCKVINDAVKEFNKAVKPISDTAVAIQQGYYDNLSNKLESLRGKLNYNWSSPNYIYSISDLISGDLDKIINKHQEYLAYQDDINAKNKAYSDWEIEKSNFLKQKEEERLAKIRQEKLEKERAEEAQKQAEEAKKRAEEIQKEQEKKNTETSQSSNSETESYSSSSSESYSSSSSDTDTFNQDTVESTTDSSK